jgi:hypothetical protein
VRDAEILEELGEALAALLVRRRQRLEDGQQILLDGEPPEHRGLLGEVGDADAGPAIHRLAGHVDAVELTRCRRRAAAGRRR